jgi:G:T/U-mismatch repair DNA glycosylase
MANSFYRKSYTNNKTPLYEVEDHPFKTLITRKSKCLVIGTFPTYKDNFQFNYYYSGTKNLFWKILEKVFNHPFQHTSGKEAVAERNDFLNEHNIGITDMVAKCYRKNRWSGDENIFPIILQNIFKTIDDGESLQRLILTSRTDVVGALGLLKTFFIQNGLNLPDPVSREDNIKQIHLIHKNRAIEILVPFSPSSRYIDTKQKFDETVNQYRKCFSL